eukprot:15455312-Alexandrium_andersonii.AAC.1
MRYCSVCWLSSRLVWALWGASSLELATIAPCKSLDDLRRLKTVVRAIVKIWPSAGPGGRGPSERSRGPKRGVGFN